MDGGLRTGLMDRGSRTDGKECNNYPGKEWRLVAQLDYSMGWIRRKLDGPFPVGVTLC
jgi:hypothetical protein